MSTAPSISETIQIANLSQVLAGIDIANSKAYLGQNRNQNLDGLIYMENFILTTQYNLNQDNPQLPGMANYVFALCGPYSIASQNILNNLAGVKPVVSGPSSQSVNVGSNATFTISVTSSSPITIQWYLGASLIPGAIGLTYTVTNAQLSQSGAQYSAIVTNSAGSTTSSIGTLTVTQSITGFLFYSNTVDPYPILEAGSDPLTYQVSFPITIAHGGQISITLPPGSGNNNFFAIKLPVSVYALSAWFNTNANNGTFSGDVVFRNELTTVGNGYDYYCSRGQQSFDVTQPLILTQS